MDVYPLNSSSLSTVLKQLITGNQTNNENPAFYLFPFDKHLVNNEQLFKWLSETNTSNNKKKEVGLILNNSTSHRQKEHSQSLRTDSTFQHQIGDNWFHYHIHFIFHGQESPQGTLNCTNIRSNYLFGATFTGQSDAIYNEDCCEMNIHI